MPGSQKFFLEFLQNPFFYSFKSILLHLELPSDPEKKSGFADERLWFLGHTVESTQFRHRKFREKQCVTPRHVLNTRQSVLVYV